ncbi:MAG: hypothetical protein WBW05_00425 [Candidatus Acidiferrum sp.]
MSLARLFRCPLVFCFLALFYSASTQAQPSIDPGKLPRRTLFYMFWHGAPSAEIRKNNSLFALWDDPQFASSHAAFIASFSNISKPDINKPAITREELDQYVPLLDNPFLVGYIPRPESHASPTPAHGKFAVAPAWDGMFLIYDRSGKEQLLSQAVTHLRGAEQDIPKLTQVTVAGVSALKIERKSDTTYWAEFSSYAVSATELSVFEQVLNVLNGSTVTNSLSESPAYKEAKPALSGGLIEFFLAIPKPDQLAANSPTPAVAQLGLILSSLKLESIHSVAGRLSLDGAKTRLNGAILGDTSAGGIFDIWPEGQANPLSVSYLSPDVIAFGESQFNLVGIYNMLKRAFAPATTASGTPSPLETMAQTRLGMPLTDALGILTGEVAWIQTSPVLDDSQKVYLLGITNKPNALKLTRSLMGDRITSERTVGTTTFLKISLHGGQSSAGVAQWNFYHLAMNPTLLFATSKTDTLQKIVAQTPAQPDPVQFKTFLNGREKFPEKLNGLSYLDLQKLDWPGLQAKWIANSNKLPQSTKTISATNTQQKWADWLKQVNPEVFPRHLHTMIGASWKDANGVHFEEWLD